jgi:hypothetical protein
MLQNFVFTYLLLAVGIAIDFLSKSHAITSGEFIKNSGMIMGSFAHLPLVSRT